MQDDSLLIFTAKKLLSCIVSFWVIITLTFFLMRAVPGDPLTQEQALPKDIYEGLRSYYGFDRPVSEQYWAYLKNIASFNLGPSLVHSGRTTTAVIVESFPVSGILGAEALLIAAAVGISFGTFSALQRGKAADAVVIIATVVLLSIPSFILGTLLQYVFGTQCGWLPIARWGSFAHSVLPALALAAAPAAFLAKLVRANMISELEQDYVFQARARGISFRRVVFRHALRNALLPAFGYLGKMSANILVGSFIIEKIFCVPGLGYWFVGSIGNRDYPMIMGLTIFYSLLLLAALFIADVAHAAMDPRLYRNKEGAVA